MVTSISLNANSATLSKGTTKQLTATVLPNNATNKTLEWISSNTKVATVSNTGLVTAITAGTATITCRATDGSGKSATCTITVEWPGDDTWSHVDYDLGKHGTRNVENNKSYTESVSDFSILGNIEQVKWSTKECTNIIIKEKKMIRKMFQV